jgi:hypothetical protein
MHPRTCSPLLALAIGVACVTAAKAQQALLGPGAAFISAGAHRVATADLDSRLAANGYPTFGRAARSLGIGAYRMVAGNVMLGGELNGLIMDEKPHQGREVGLGGGYATLGIAYAMQLSPRARVYPRLGLGAGGLALWIETADTLAFDDVLSNPTPAASRERLLSRDGGVIDLGVGLELIPGRRGSGALIGLRAGYVIASFGSGSGWQMNDGAATNGPSASIAGPYVRLVVGGAWNR